MRLTSELFNTKYCMNTNAITIGNGAMIIHSTDTMENGFILKYEVEDDGNVYDLTISKKDFATLAKLGSFDLKVENNVIHVKNNNVKMKLGNMVESHLHEPDIGEMKPLNLKGKDVLDGKEFITDNDKTQIQLHGVSVFTNGIIATDKQTMYTSYKETQVEDAINIPKSCFKYIDPEADVYTDGRLAVFISGNVMMYTNLIAVKLGDMATDKMKVPTVLLKLDSKELKHYMSILQGYDGGAIELELIENVLHLKQQSNANEFDFTLPVEVVQGSKLHITTSQKSMNAILSKMNDEPLGFCKINMVIHDQKKDAYTIATYTNGHMEVA